MSCACAICSAPKISAVLRPPAVDGGVSGGVSGGDPFTLPAATINDRERGLNKALRQEKERGEAVKDDVVPRLNPPFPYRVIPPPLDYFRFPANPPTTLADGD